MSTDAQRYAEGLNALNAETGPAYEGHTIDTYHAGKPDPRYTRIICQHHGSYGQQMVHAFVENATGAVFKAAGWVKPANGPRYATVEDALAAARASRNQYGVTTGYLYADYRG